MNEYTPQLFPTDDPNRIVPLDEGRARLAQIREHVSGLPGEDAAAVACQVGSNIWMQHDLDHDLKCKRCHFQAVL